MELEVTWDSVLIWLATSIDLISLDACNKTSWIIRRLEKCTINAQKSLESSICSMPLSFSPLLAIGKLRCRNWQSRQWQVELWTLTMTLFANNAKWDCLCKKTCDIDHKAITPSALVCLLKWFNCTVTSYNVGDPYTGSRLHINIILQFKTRLLSECELGKVTHH